MRRRDFFLSLVALIAARKIPPVAPPDPTGVWMGSLEVPLRWVSTTGVWGLGASPLITQEIVNAACARARRTGEAVFCRNDQSAPLIFRPVPRPYQRGAAQDLTGPDEFLLFVSTAW